VLELSINTILPWITQYGVFALFTLLALGIIGLPIPDETLIVFAGFLISKGQLPLVSTVIAVVAGACVGISMSYLLGRTAGHRLAQTLMKKLSPDSSSVARVRLWFAKIGTWILFFGYFIPGVRHLSGFIAGASELAYPQFAFFAYAGAIAWSATFLALGYYFGDRWQAMLEALDPTTGILLIIFAICLGSYLYRRLLTR
jgi:membrane protein DedA with SNARE-associated domain